MHIKLKLAASLLIAALVCVASVAAAQYDTDFALEDLYNSAPDAVTEELGLDALTPEELTERLSPEKTVDFLTGNFVTVLRGNISSLAAVAGLLIVMGVYDVLRDGFAARGTARMSDFFCAASVALVVCPAFVERINELSGAVSELSGYMELSLPVLSALLAASGHVGAAAVLHFFIYNAAAFVGRLFASVLLPLTGTYMCIGIAAAVTDNEGLRGISAGLRAMTNRGVVIACTLFTALLSLQGIISGAGDTVSRRAVKLAVGSFLPVTGNLMTESVDTFMSGVGIIRSVAGAFGVIVVFYLIIIPILKTAANYLLIKLSAFLCGMVGSPRVRAMLGVIADGYSMLISMAAGVGVMFIVCMAFLLIAGGAV